MGQHGFVAVVSGTLSGSTTDHDQTHERQAGLAEKISRRHPALESLSGRGVNVCDVRQRTGPVPRGDRSIAIAAEFSGNVRGPPNCRRLVTGFSGRTRTQTAGRSASSAEHRDSGIVFWSVQTAGTSAQQRRLHQSAGLVWSTSATRHSRPHPRSLRPSFRKRHEKLGHQKPRLYGRLKTTIRIR